MDHNVIEIEVASPPDREWLVANLLVQSQQLAEINREGSQLAVEIYPRLDGKPWRVSHVELVAALERAARELDY